MNRLNEKQLGQIYEAAVGHPGPVLIVTDLGMVVDCRDCGFAHLWPYPEEIEDYYAPGRYKAEHQRPHASRFHEEQADAAWHDMQWDERLDAIEKHMSVSGQYPCILDVGAGYGWFMMRATSRGWLTWGIEPDADAVDYTQRTLLVRRNLDDLEASQEFDAVHASFVLEHVRQPAELLSRLWEVLAPGGVMCIAVPNDEPLIQDGYEFVVREEHLCYFSHASIRALVEKAGFRVVDQWASFPFDVLVRAGVRYDRYPRFGHLLHHVRMGIELLLYRLRLNGAKLWLYRRLVERGLGRASVVIAVKDG